jgi:hypothetical protein
VEFPGPVFDRTAGDWLAGHRPRLSLRTDSYLTAEARLVLVVVADDPAEVPKQHPPQAGLDPASRWVGASSGTLPKCWDLLRLASRA